MNLTQQRQLEKLTIWSAEQEHRITKLQVQVEDLTARLDSYAQVLESLRYFSIELSTMLKKIKETASE